jgi:hypothetical protein
MTNSEYEYNSEWKVPVLFTVVFGLWAIGMAAIAYRNDRGVIINGIRFDQMQATVLGWAGALFLVACTLVFALEAYPKLFIHQRIAFGPTGLVVPVSKWSSEEMEIKYSDIHDLARDENGDHLSITHKGGVYLITARGLKGLYFALVCMKLEIKLKESRAGLSHAICEKDRARRIDERITRLD